MVSVAGDYQTLNDAVAEDGLEAVRGLAVKQPGRQTPTCLRCRQQVVLMPVTTLEPVVNARVRVHQVGSES
jgi:hypothetical protein